MVLSMAAIVVTGLTGSGTLQSAFAVDTTITSYDNAITCLHGYSSNLNSATANLDGSLAGIANTNKNNDYGQTTSFAYKSMDFTKDDYVVVSATSYVTQTTGDPGGTTNAIAYVAKAGTIYANSNSGCTTNGAAFSGSIANLNTATGVDAYYSQSASGTSSGFTIPSTGSYDVVIYLDTNTNQDGYVTGSLSSTSITVSVT